MQNLFIELLQVTLGTREILSRVPTSVEWNAIYDEARRQAVVGVSLCGIDKLPKGQRPQQLLLLQWIGATEAIRKRNLILNQRCVELQKLYTNDGYESCILKGQGNALLYPDPLLRQGGDILCQGQRI